MASADQLATDADLFTLDLIDCDRDALFLDVDGTLIDIAATPDSVVVPTRLPGLLDALRRRLSGALALVTGRNAATVDLLLQPAVLPVAGLHGAELRMPGAILEAPHGAEVERIKAALAPFVAERKGLLLEDKGAAVAVHYRLAPDFGPEVIARCEALLAEAGETLELQLGKMVAEFRPRGANKGRAVEWFMALDDFAGRRPVMLGDDLTDEAAFRVARAMGGRAVRVGTDERKTEATERLSDPATVHAWLAACLRASRDVEPNRNEERS